MAQKVIKVQKIENGKILHSTFNDDMWKRIKRLPDNKWQLEPEPKKDIIKPKKSK